MIRTELSFFQLFLVLRPTEVDLISKKKVCKRISVRAGDFSASKVVFTLLIGVITLYVRLTTVHVRRLGFELISR